MNDRGARVRRISVVRLVGGCVLLAACAGPSSKGGAGNKEAVETVSSALLGAAAPPNFKVFDPFFENSAKVGPPSAQCPNGSIVLNMGQPRGADGFLQRPLYNAAGAIDTTSPTLHTPYPVPSTSATHTDNQIVRLKDGSFLGLKEGFTIADLDPEPFWFHELISGTLGVTEGGRGGVHIFHSVCVDSWELRSIIDWATVAGGVYGVPGPLDDNGNFTTDCSQQGHDANGRQRWTAGGSDRPEFYACPFTGNIYVTDIVGSGPFCDANGNKTVDRIDASTLLYSTDQGQTWNEVARMSRTAPDVMTSTPDGRLFVFGVGATPFVRYTQPLAPGDVPVLGPEQPVLYNDGSGDIPTAVVADADLFINPVTHLSVSRISTDTTDSKIRASYPSVNTSGMEETRVVSISVPSGGGAPTIAPIVTIHPEDPQDHSTLYFSFIEPDYIDIPAGTVSNVTMGYWIEPPRCRVNEVRCVTPNFEAQCFNLQTDNLDCGTCGHACATGQVCSQGTCVAACAASETSCNQCDLYHGCRPNCVDLKTNVRNCGSCGNVCNFGQTCSGGVCVTGNGKKGYSIRHMFFEGACRSTTPKLLSLNPDQTPRYFETRPNASGSGGIGDYMYGGFWWKNAPNYFAHWSEIDQLNGATVQSPFSPAAAPSTTCEEVVALCNPVTLDAGATCTATGLTADRVDNGSFGPHGTAPSLALSSGGPFPFGTTTVTLTATTGPQSSTCTAAITVRDVTPPTVTAPPNVNVVSCGGTDGVNVGTATAKDNCATSPPVTGRVISRNGVTLTPPLTVTGGRVQLAPGTYVIQWTASDGVSTSAPVFQTVIVRSAIQASQGFLVDDRALIRNNAGGFAAVANSGSGLTQLGHDARSATVVSVGPVNLQPRSIVAGDVVSAAAVTKDTAATVNGTITQFSTVTLPPLPTLPAFPPPTGNNMTINGTFSPAPGSYRSITLNSGATLNLAAGTYFFQSLIINSAVTVRAQATTRVFVQSQIAVRSPFRNAGGATQSIFLGYAGASLVMEAAFNGTLVAPNASVAFGVGSGLTFTGAFFARQIEVRPDSSLVCLASAAP